MKKRLVRLLLAITLIGTSIMGMENQAHAITQDELIRQLKEAGHGINSGSGQSLPASGYEFGGSFDGLVPNVQQKIRDVTKQRAAERGLSVQEYLDQTGQSHAAKYFDEATLNSKPSGSGTATTTEPVIKHEHSYRGEVTKEPTCTETGIKTFTCECGNTYTEELPKTEHVYTKEITKEATCSEPGIITYTCVCGDTYEEKIPVTDHQKGAVETVKEVTCTEAGERKVYCKFCGEELESEVIEAYGHTEGKATVEKEPTMFVKGLKVVRCVDCGEVLHSEELPIQWQNWYYIGGVTIIILIGAVVVIVKRKKK